MTTTRHPVDRLLDEITAGRGISTDYWADDARLDATVPNWRFDRCGPEAVAAQLSRWYNVPITIDSVIRTEVPGGETVRLDLSWVEHGVPYAAHQVHLLSLDGEQIAVDTVFCGGRWSAALLAEMEDARVG